MFTGLKAVTHFGRPQFQEFLESLHIEHPEVSEKSHFVVNQIDYQSAFEFMRRLNIVYLRVLICMSDATFHLLS